MCGRASAIFSCNSECQDTGQGLCQFGRQGTHRHFRGRLAARHRRDIVIIDDPHREHLTELEVDRLIKVAKGNRWGQRDATMFLIGSSLVTNRWQSETGTAIGIDRRNYFEIHRRPDS